MRKVVYISYVKIGFGWSFSSASLTTPSPMHPVQLSYTHTEGRRAEWAGGGVCPVHELLYVSFKCANGGRREGEGKDGEGGVWGMARVREGQRVEGVLEAWVNPLHSDSLCMSSL